MENIQLTILIPALNEEHTIGIVIKRAQYWIERKKIVTEILVVNNGSTDHTKDLAMKLGVKVIDISKIGYGSALLAGIQEAKGKDIIMGDADDSYHFDEIDTIFEELQNGNDIVIGNRYANMEKGSMKFTHRIFGTPLLNFCIKKKYKFDIADVNCGLRGFKKDKILTLNLTSTGMEFASEMMIKAWEANLKIKEVPIHFYKDKRNKKSHLRPISDAIRHIKVIYKK